jgi:hypothetical protein
VGVQEQLRLAHTMCDRVNVNRLYGTRYVSIERQAAKYYGRLVDMTRVAWAIKFKSQGVPERD